jgi:hypothetical protein
MTDIPQQCDVEATIPIATPAGNGLLEKHWHRKRRQRPRCQCSSAQTLMDAFINDASSSINE